MQSAITLISIFLIHCTESSATLVPKDVLKLGLMTFIQEITQPASDENLCFVVFENYVHGVLDRGMDFDEAFETAFNVDHTHSFAKGKCQMAYDKFHDVWKQFAVKDNKVCV